MEACHEAIQRVPHEGAPLPGSCPTSSSGSDTDHAHCTRVNTPCFTAGGIFMPNSQIRFSGPFSRAPNLPYRGYPERLSTAHTVTIRPISSTSSAPLSIAQPPISFVTHITVNQLDINITRPYSYVYKVRRTSSTGVPLLQLPS